MSCPASTPVCWSSSHIPNKRASTMCPKLKNAESRASMAMRCVISEGCEYAWKCSLYLYLSFIEESYELH
jgi:hypothetical protein